MTSALGFWSKSALIPPMLRRSATSIVSEAGKAVYSVEYDEPQPQVDFAFGFLIVKPPPVMVSMKSTSAFFRYWTLIGSTNSLTPCDSKA